MSEPTDVQIANLLAIQTYAERMEMAETFRDYINTWLDEHTEPTDRADSEIVAFWFECYVDSFPDADETGPA